MKKQKKKAMKKIKVILEKIKRFLEKIIKGIVVLIGLTSCGSTKAVISKPAEGTSTTITITTNNPITTNVEPTLNTKQL